MCAKLRTAWLEDKAAVGKELDKTDKLVGNLDVEMKLRTEAQDRNKLNATHVHLIFTLCYCVDGACWSL